MKIAAALALALLGCSTPQVRVVAQPSAPAVAPNGAKATGEVVFAGMRDDVPTGGKYVPHEGTLAQTADGTLGDSLFREDEFGFVEGCRWVPRGRICNLITLSDGTYLGGGVTWMIPKNAKATPRASGWVFKGVASAFVPTQAGGPAQYTGRATLVGKVFHCRFADDGPKCLDVPALKQTTGFVPLGAFSLQDGGARREVLWVGIFGDMSAETPVATGQAAGIKEIQRCETTEDANEVTCKLVAMKD